MMVTRHSTVFDLQNLMDEKFDAAWKTVAALRAEYVSLSIESITPDLDVALRFVYRIFNMVRTQVIINGIAKTDVQYIIPEWRRVEFLSMLVPIGKLPNMFGEVKAQREFWEQIAVKPMFSGYTPCHVPANPPFGSPDPASVPRLLANVVGVPWQGLGGGVGMYYPVIGPHLAGWNGAPPAQPPGPPLHFNVPCQPTSGQPSRQG